MLHDRQIEITLGKAVGGDFIRITHMPTGISRGYGPPLATGKKMYEIKKKMMKEIEEELEAKGLSEYIWKP